MCKVKALNRFTTQKETGVCGRVCKCGWRTPIISLSQNSKPTLLIGSKDNSLVEEQQQPGGRRKESG